jgi:hypothetical protein
MVGVGDDNHVAFSQIFPGEKGNARSCVIVMEERVVLSLKFGVKS